MAQRTRICTINGCEKPAAGAWCSMHYERWRIHGSTDSPRPTLEQRLMAKVEKRPDGCWQWTSTKNKRGYGRFCVGGRGNTKLAHRVAYEHFIGPVPQGLELDHLCRNPGCVNPSHLEPVTHQENMRRAYEPMMEKV